MNGEEVANQIAQMDGTEMCARCGRVISRLEQPFVCGDQIVCFGCHRHAQERELDNTPATAEFVFLEDARIRITRNHVNTRQLHFNMADIRSARIRKIPARRLLAVLIVLLGFTLVALGFNRDPQQWDRIPLAAGTALLGIGLFWNILIRTKHLVLVTVHDAEKRILVSRNHKYAKRVAEAIALALVERGQNPPLTGHRTDNEWGGEAQRKQEQFAY